MIHILTSYNNDNTDNENNEFNLMYYGQSQY